MAKLDIPNSIHDNEAPSQAHEGVRGASPRLARCALFAAAAVMWLALDMLTKGYFNAFEPGELVAGPFAGLVQFRLVHNTGAAWGMFGDATFALGVVAVAVCVALAAYVVACAPQLSCVSTVALALVFAGGVGNALDRFSLGYVVDFIETVFISFPVFNVADIGVTCGIVMALLALVAEWRREAA